MCQNLLKSAEKKVSVFKLKKTEKKHQGCRKLLISIGNKGGMRMPEEGIEPTRALRSTGF
jgi:hypothetical protein